MGVTLGQFEIHLGQLLRSEQFLRQQAQSSGSTAPLVLQRTQNEAQISLGMAAADFAALPSPLPTPSPTPPPVAESNVTPPPTPDLVQRERGIGVGQLLPDFSLPTLPLDEAATPVSLGADDSIGTPTVLSFYTTWCRTASDKRPILGGKCRVPWDRACSLWGLMSRNQGGDLALCATTWHPLPGSAGLKWQRWPPCMGFPAIPLPIL